MVKLYNFSKLNISEHIKHILEEKEEKTILTNIDNYKIKQDYSSILSTMNNQKNKRTQSL